jgi:cobalt-zinc-cadmium efflux system membrane fusion protein
MSAATILLVDDDETLSRVLRRVLGQQGYTVVEAGNVQRALQVARETPPQLGLLDLRLPDGDGVELARKLTEQGARFPVILMTAFPLRLRDQPELARQFFRVLTKPLNLQELRQAIEAALTEPRDDKAPVPSALDSPPASTPSGTALPPGTSSATESNLPSDTDAATTAAVGRKRRAGLVAAVLLVLVVLGILVSMGLVLMNGRHSAEPETAVEKSPATTLAATLAKDDPDGLVLPAAVVQRLGLTSKPVAVAAGTRPLHLTGFINYDPDYLQRVHALFGGEVIDVAEVEENVHGATERRRLSFNDRVHKGELLAVVWSKDLGQMKSALVDALVHQRFDEETLTRYQTLASSGSISEVALRTQQATVSLDRNTANSAENALVTARVPPEEISAVKEEAKRIYERSGKHDPEVEKTWPRVEVRARMDGTIVEKNVVVGDTVDTAKDMFVIADLNKVTIWANAYEEDLRDLNNLTLPYPWVARLAADTRPGDPVDSAPELRSSFFDRISPAIDPNQHTATLMGRVEPRAAQKAFVGRMVAVTIELPQAANTVAVPVSAMDEDGEASIVFVQPESDRPYFSMRRVAVAQRLPDVVLVRSRLTEDELRKGLQPLQPGERVVTQQAYLLRGALDDLKAAK